VSESNGQPRVFRWELISNWGPQFWSNFEDTIDASVIREIQKLPNSSVVSDDLEWLGRAIYRANGVCIDARDLLCNRFVRSFDSIQAYHGCRPRDVASYYQLGLLPCDTNTLNDVARAHFLSAQFPEITAELLETAIAEVPTILRSGRTFLSLDARDQLMVCPQYLRYGSEYVQCIAAQLTRLTGRDGYRESLKVLGQPTLFICIIPLGLLRQELLCELAACVFVELLEQNCGPFRNVRMAGFGFELDSIPPSCIIGNYSLPPSFLTRKTSNEVF
jgi:hypothetical protein